MTNPLKRGDEIRVIAPSYHASGKIKNKRQSERAKERLESLGCKITFGEHIHSVFHLGTANVADRVSDLHDAYIDKDVKAILAFTGGWSANELLPYIDWELVRNNPKPIIGFSDITVLLNAVYAKTGQVGFLGPNFITMGKMTSWQYTLNNLNTVLTKNIPILLEKSKVWSDSPSDRYKTKPWQVIQPGFAEAVLLGGNIGTFYLLQGTNFQPKFDKPFIFAVEDDDAYGKLTAREFSRRLESILQLPGFRDNLKGLIIGRFQPGSYFKMSDIESVVKSKRLGDIPVISNVDFGHTIPLLTLPIGGIISVDATNRKTKLKIISG